MRVRVRAITKDSEAAKSSGDTSIGRGSVRLVLRLRRHLERVTWRGHMGGVWKKCEMSFGRSAEAHRSQGGQRGQKGQVDEVECWTT